MSQQEAVTFYTAQLYTEEHVTAASPLLHVFVKRCVCVRVYGTARGLQYWQHGWWDKSYVQQRIKALQKHWKIG